MRTCESKTSNHLELDLEFSKRKKIKAKSQSCINESQESFFKFPQDI